MDIVEIGKTDGQNQNFMDLVHPSQREKCLRYQKKAGGPTNLFKNLDGRNAMDFARDAFKPLKKYSDKIAVVIDGSTTRGFAYPSAAQQYCQELGIKADQAFDMMEACNGFCRALETSYYMYLTKPELKDKYIMIINNEQPPETRGKLPSDIKNYAEVASYYVGLTFSYTCTITILKKSDNHSWRFHKNTTTKYATNINIPLPYISKSFEPACEYFGIREDDSYAQFCIPSHHDLKGKGHFALSVLVQNYDFFKNDCNIMTHTFSRYVYEMFFEKACLSELRAYYNEVGNLGSCSFPWILYDTYGPTIPDQQKCAFVGNAAGGSNMTVFFRHQDKSQPEFIKYENNELVDHWKINAFLFYQSKILGSLGINKQTNFIKCQSALDRPAYKQKKNQRDEANTTCSSN